MGAVKAGRWRDAGLDARQVALCWRLAHELRGAPGMPAFHALFALVAMATSVLLIRSAQHARRSD